MDMDSRMEIARGWDLFREGAFAEAESLVLGHANDPEALHQLLWIAIRRGDTEHKHAYGERLSACEEPSLAAVGRAHQNVALATLNRGLEPWLNPFNKWAKAEIAYARALIAFIEHRPTAVRENLSEALPQNAEQRVRYAQLRGWIKGLAEDFEGQAIALTHALHLAINEGVDAGLTATVAEPLAALIREVELDGIGLRAEELLEVVTWPRDQSRYHFSTQRALAWRKGLRGDWIRAMRLLDNALQIAPDAMRRGLIHSDRARIGQTISEPVAAASSRSLAFQCFFDVNWKNAREDEALGVFGAMDALRVDEARARELFQKAAGTEPTRFNNASQGRRSAAFQNFALAQLLTEGEQALRHATDAYKVFKEIKYRHRAAACALRAVELGGGERWRSRVERLVEDYPRSLVASQYQAVTSPVRCLRGRMREIAELLAFTDKTTKEIALNLGIAEGTVRVHTQRIKKSLNVETRAQLVRLVLESNYEARSA